jgi:hypothetical protein
MQDKEKVVNVVLNGTHIVCRKETEIMFEIKRKGRTQPL